MLLRIECLTRNVALQNLTPFSSKRDQSMGFPPLLGIFLSSSIKVTG